MRIERRGLFIRWRQEFLFDQQRRISRMQVCKNRKYCLPGRWQWKDRETYMAGLIR